MKLKRTIMCGDARAAHIGQTVTVNGWVAGIREFGGLVFIDVRDRAGLLQLVFDKDTVPALHEQAKRFAREYVIAARGTVGARGPKQVNPNMPTGEVEVMVAECELLNTASTPPIEVRDDKEFDPELRLTYRYIDLRRPSMQEIFRKRHRLIKALRDHFDSKGFLEIETPLLTRPTPEGARDFLVPARLHPGTFYALPQSPQIFKQILMIAGFDKYFQLARCMRDEDKRGDRQPEHTQLDLEMSFVEPSDVHAAVEGAVARAMKDVMGVEIATPLPHMSHEQAMRDYGSDKPDLRISAMVVDLSKELAACGFGVFVETIKAGGAVKALRVPGGHEKISKGQFKNLEKDAKGRGAKGLAFLRLAPEGVDSPIAKFLGDTGVNAITTATGATSGDMVLMVADKPDVAGRVLGDLRNVYAEPWGLRAGSEAFKFLWVDNFPQFEYDEEHNQITPAHHPFVAPVQEDALIALAEELKRTDRKVTPQIRDLALSIRATQYDIVVNGVELGSGSLRITKKEVQDAAFTCIGLSAEQAQAKFGFLLEALKYGAPPMAGIGMGIDRWLMVLLGLDTIQDVIAFPKTAGGKGLMDGCPSPADDAQLKELSIRIAD